MDLILLGVTGVLFFVAGPVMAVRGLIGRKAITQELVQQRIAFPAGGNLPAGLSRYAGVQVRTGEQAKAYSDLIGSHVAKATGGRTYAEISTELQAGGRTDEKLVRLREMAFMGQTLRGALLGAYQASQVTLLVIGLGALFTALGLTFLALALIGS
ncbi:hypothetical protein GCM10027280_40130 [Micromonospora polyrhachis]|uniref:Uncharacterized protein n=1 Tax=Micromonospora polyrhachis TaxID=1282883 RepID=A0A7W7SKY5_9ACTN|nr:hypothetical protein [Micromonospora polyrhachis]MBB4956713.1 hypothetical protein [Micromonospora polyrhachis]